MKREIHKVKKREEITHIIQRNKRKLVLIMIVTITTDDPSNMKHSQNRIMRISIAYTNIYLYI